MGTKCCHGAQLEHVARVETKSLSVQPEKTDAIAEETVMCTTPACVFAPHAEARLSHPSGRRQHPLLEKHPKLSQAVRFVDLEKLSELPVPLPRCQDVDGSFFRPLLEGDLLIAVSHAWTNQTHPDPTGKKVNTMLETLLASVSSDCKNCCRQDAINSMALERVNNALNFSGAVLFFDFLSVAQPPFHPGQEPRTTQETEAFRMALEHMHLVFLYADVIFHLDGISIDNDEESRGIVDVEPTEVQGSVTLCRVGETWQVHSVSTAIPTYNICPGDVLKFKDDSVSTHPDCNPLTCSHTLTIERRNFGALNVTPAEDRGWLYLERFITMVRVAMIGIDRFESCVICTSMAVRELIEAGACILGDAIKTDRLAEVLVDFKDVLLSKKFSAASTDELDAVAIKMAIGNVFSSLDTGQSLRGDALIVYSIMESGIAYLNKSWQEVRVSVVDDAFLELGEMLYERVKADAHLAPFFRGTKPDHLQRHQGCFLRELWLGRRPALPNAVHSIWNIQPQHFNAFIGHFEASLHDFFGYEHSHRINAFKTAVRSYEEEVVQHFQRTSAPPNLIDDVSALKEFLQTASLGARLGALPDLCALNLAQRLQRACRDEHLDDSNCPAMSTQAAAAFVSLLPDELRGLGHIAISGSKCSSALPSAHVQPSEEQLQRFLDHFYERLSSDEITQPFFTKKSRSFAHVVAAQKDLLAELLMTSVGPTARLHELVRRSHAQLVISDFQFDRFVAISLEVGSELDPAFGLQIAALFEGFRTSVIQDHVRY
mmetsp:Transcript_27767/g.54527  ORF Transcript_27767/g.54527 Transcript_27767/m.54527 type:complete len:771 (-) Transcript_27767:58-2370(-)